MAVSHMQTPHGPGDDAEADQHGINACDQVVWDERKSIVGTVYPLLLRWPDGMNDPIGCRMIPLQNFKKTMMHPRHRECCGEYPGYYFGCLVYGIGNDLELNAGAIY